ncbi:MAG: amidohydrolase family protein [Gemmatimonadaceae bacterium]
MLAHTLLATTLALSADTTTYVVLNHGRPAGEMRVVADADSLVVTYGHIDRNRGRWVQSRYLVDADGSVRAGESRPMTRDGAVGAATDGYEIAGDSVRFTRGGDDARTVARRDGVYALANSTAWDQARIVRHLLARPAHTTRVLPTGIELRLEIAADTVVPSTRGGVRLRLAMLHGVGATSQAVWVDASGALAASAVGWFVTVRPDIVPALPLLRAIETAYRNEAGNALASQIRVTASGLVVIRDADVFEAERGVLLPRHTIVVEGGRITAVGPAASVRTPRGAHVIDAGGKTVVPGLWDMHTHFQLASQTGTVVRHLAIGVTTIRDMASDTDVGLSHRDRANAGTIVSPRVILAGFIEGPGLWAGPSDVLVRTEAEAREWVARYDSLGYRQVKLYNLVHPDLVPAIAAEARARGMRLSGHVPRGLSVGAAIRLGFDEINHAAFLFSTFHQDSLYYPTMRPYSGVAAVVAPNTDVDGAPMTALLADLKAHGTVVDGTFNLWMRDTTGSDSLSARAGNRAYLRLVRRLFDAGVTIVPGTDGSSYNAELELYERAGIPPMQVLQLATLGSARVMGEAAAIGNIAPGMVADLVIIDGRPTERIADLRRVHLVMRGGRAYAPADLLAGVNNRPPR